MSNKLFYYELKVYIPYDGYHTLMISHERHFDDLELHSVIQDVIDETIIDHVEKANVKRYCDSKYWDLFGEYNRYRFGLFLSNKGFDVIHPCETITIEDRPILSDDRYKNVEIKSCTGPCPIRYDDEECPIVAKRIEDK
jgi:hypothetical protein